MKEYIVITVDFQYVNTPFQHIPGAMFKSFGPYDRKEMIEFLAINDNGYFKIVKLPQ